MNIQYHDKNHFEELEIVTFHPEYIHTFKELNLEWLRSYFVVEAYDIKVLENAEKYIINKGGHIFFSKYNDEIVGTVTLIRIEEGVFELSKIAVLPTHRGLNIGQKLIQHVIDFSKVNGWKKLVLYSNTKLENAIHIYKKFGFNEIAVEENCVYLRCNIKMVLPIELPKNTLVNTS